MKRFFIIIFMSLLCDMIFAADFSCSSDDSALVIKLLQSSKKQSSSNLMIYFARQLIGVPYVAHTLDVNKKEHLIINIHQMDCYTYVETVTALTLCAKQHKYDFYSFVNTVRSLRYRDGKIQNYASRLHYFTDWIIENIVNGYVREVQSPNPPFTSIQTIKVGFMSENYKKYSMLKANPQLVPEIKMVEQSLNGRRYRYIPKTLVENNNFMRKAVRNGDIIAIITDKKGLDTSHVGIAVWHQDGLHLLNASQLHHKVIEENMTFANYLSQHPIQIGVRVVRIVQ